MLGVLYPNVMAAIISSIHYLYNTQWRGLAELLIQNDGQCESLNMG